MSGGFLLKRWTVTVRWVRGESLSCDVIATSRGKALADAWRSDGFNGYSFRDFLGITSCCRNHDIPPRFGDPITVLGKPAFYVEGNNQYVRFAYAGGEHVFNAHPYDVEPESYRPGCYRSAAA